MRKLMSMSLMSISLVAIAAVACPGQDSQDGGGQQQQQAAATPLGDVVRSVSMAKLQGATASGQYEQSRQLYMQNQAQAVAAYFEMRRYQRQHKATGRTSPFSTEQYVRQAREQAPDRLPPSQLDSLTGEIRWPQALLMPHYESRRANLQRLFSELRVDYPVADEIQKACVDFQNQVKADIRTFAGSDYIVALQFLKSLHYEATAQNQ